MDDILDDWMMQERAEAVSKFTTDGEGASTMASTANDKTFEPEEDFAAAQAHAGIHQSEAKAARETPVEKKGPSPAQLLALQAAIANAATLDEIQRLEAALTSGHLPSELNEAGNGPQDMDVEQ